MVSRWRVATGLAIACAASAATLLVPGLAQAAQTPAEIRQYWTDERMREALPAELLLDGANSTESSAPAKRGGGTAKPVRRYRRPPKRTHGKVFFTLDGTNYVCSATVVRSPSESLVMTAGHCVYDCVPRLLQPCRPTRASRFLFIPAYKNGSKPFGEWAASRVRATDQYEGNQSFGYDVGAALIASRNGRHIQDAVGGRKIAFNQPVGATVRLFGYPALAPFNGEIPYVCRESSPGRDQSVNPPSIQAQCNMTGGSSGGGWIGASGRLISVTSYGDNPDSGHLYGPYFGNAVKGLYQSMKNG